MDKITSFEIDHIKLVPGVYLSRIDYMDKMPITTYDLRMTAPNDEPVMHTDSMHAIEHLAATYLRNHPHYGNDVIYFGPMGCRTGFYLILKEDRSSKDILPLIIETFEFISEFKEKIPGASPEGCGNYQDMNLPMARYRSKRYAELLHKATEENLNYPQ